VSQAGQRDRKQKRDRPQNLDGPSNLAPSERLRKHRRTSLVDSAVKDTYEQRATGGINDRKSFLIEYWSEKKFGLEEFLKQDDHIGKEFQKAIGVSDTLGNRDEVKSPLCKEEGEGVFVFSS
jgi:hypothetical protein